MTLWETPPPNALGPTLTHLRRSEWTVKPVSPREGREFIAKYHYSKGSSITGVYFHGLYRVSAPDELMGVAHWLPPTKPAAVSVDPENWRRVLSLSRLACHPSCPTNAASFLMGRSIRLIKLEGKWKSLVTYADESQGHQGQIYKATNWIHKGQSSKTDRWIDPKTGKQVAKLSTKSRTNAQMLSLGYIKTGPFYKIKFVMHL